MDAISSPKFPAIEVQLTGTDGNAFALIGTVQKALRRAGVSETEVKQFAEEAMAGDYDHLLRTCCAWVEVN